MVGVYGFPSQTEKGLRNVSTTMIVFLIAQLVGVALLVALLPVLVGAIINPGDPAIIAAAITLLAVLCVLLIVIVIGFIFGLIGLIALYKGRDEFGPEHARRIDRGILVLILGILLPGAVNLVGGAAVGGAGGVVGLSPRLTVGAAAASLVAGILGSTLVGLFLLWCIEALASPQLRQRAMIALFLGIISGIVSGAAALAVVYTVQIPTSPTMAQLVPFLVPSIVSAAISFVSLLVWYMTYRGVLDRFRTGELRATPPVMYPPPYGQPYGPYAPYPYAPPPPPQQPPPGSPPPNP